MRANSNKGKIIALVTFLFVPFLGFLIRMTAEETSDIMSKIIRVFLFYLIVVLLVAHYRKISIAKEWGKYFWITFFLAIPYFIHFFVSKANTELFNTYALNELIVLVSLILIFTVSSLFNFKFSDYHFLAWSMSIYGIALGLLSIWYSVSIVPTRFMDMYVGEFLRAGTEATDPNLIGAVLNICSMAAIGVYLAEKNMIRKILSIFAFLISQAGRFFTFSTGAFFSILFSLIALSLFLKENNRKSIVRFIMIILIVSFGIIISLGMADILFSRIIFPDESVMQSSIYSRVDQYREFLRLIEENPLRLLYGTGSARLPELLRLDLSLHNSYLRPLAIGGVISFGAFMLLYWLCFKNFQKSLRYSADPKMEIVIASFFASFIGWSFQAATLPSDISGINLFFFTIAYSLKRSVWRDYENHNSIG